MKASVLYIYTSCKLQTWCSQKIHWFVHEDYLFTWYNYNCANIISSGVKLIHNISILWNAHHTLFKFLSHQGSHQGSKLLLYTSAAYMYKKCILLKLWVITTSRYIANKMYFFLMFGKCRRQSTLEKAIIQFVSISQSNKIPTELYRPLDQQCRANWEMMFTLQLY